MTAPFPLVIGLDLSITRTGLCVEGVPSHYTPAKGSRLARCRQIRDHVDFYAERGADLAVIEAIGTRMVDTAITLGGLHLMVLDLLDRRSIEVLTVTPADLKRFAVGKGNADKDTTTLAASRWLDIANHDQADAAWLYAIGCHVAGEPFLPVPGYRADVTAKLAGLRVAA